MAYFMEMGADPDEGVYLEFVIVNKNTGGVVRGDNVEHQFNVFGWQDCSDYGFWGNQFQTVASNSNGMITAPAPGVVAVAIPPGALFGGVYDAAADAWSGWCAPDRNRVLRFKLVAISTSPSMPTAPATKILVKGTISFGDRVMPCPRIQLGTYPLYPNSATAAPVIGAQVAQVKQQLAKIGSYDTIQAALTGGPTDPATTSWNTGGTVLQNGPLVTLISAKLFNSDPIATGFFLAAASTIPL